MYTETNLCDMKPFIKVENGFASMQVAGKQRILPMPQARYINPSSSWFDDEETEELLRWEQNEGHDQYHHDSEDAEILSVQTELEEYMKTYTPLEHAPVYGGISQPSVSVDIMRDLSQAEVVYAKTLFENGNYLQCYGEITKIIQLCSNTVEYSANSNSDEMLPHAEFREKKSQLLRDLILFGRDCGFLFLSHEPCLRASMVMIAKNIFRPLPPRPEMIADEEDSPPAPQIWEDVLHYCYDYFLNILSFQAQPDLPPGHPPGLTELTKVLKQLINAPFVLKLVEAFNSDIGVERDFLKTLLHRVYAKFMSLRATIRKALNNYFFVFVYERDDLYGVSEMLEILGSIINGFALPLKNEHVTFFRRVLLVLHKSPRIATFFPQLSYCVVQFVDKDPTLAHDVYNVLYRYWPATHSSKAVMFLTTLEECLEVVDLFQSKSDEMCEIVASITYKGMSSPSFAVAERAACMWQSEVCSQVLCDLHALQHLIGGNRFGMFVDRHWNFAIRSLMDKILDHIRMNQKEIVDQAQKQYDAYLEQKNDPRRRQIEDFFKQLVIKSADVIKDFPAVPKRARADKLPPCV